MLLDLLPQPADVNVHGFRVADEIDSPDLLQQLITTPDPFRVLKEELEDLVLLGGEIEVVPITGDAALVDVQA